MATFFSHDSDAMRDPKIIRLRMNLGWHGYGVYWALIELLSQADGKYELPRDYENYAFELQVECNCIATVVEGFGLFEFNETTFWSKSLKMRMKYKDDVSKKRKNAAKKRWENQGLNANAMQMHSKSNASAMQNHANKTKRNETKLNNKGRFKKPTHTEIKNYCDERKNSVDSIRFFDFYESKGWKVGSQPMKDWKAAVRTWERKTEPTNTFKDTRNRL